MKELKEHLDQKIIKLREEYIEELEEDEGMHTNYADNKKLEFAEMLREVLFK